MTARAGILSNRPAGVIPDDVGPEDVARDEYVLGVVKPDEFMLEVDSRPATKTARRVVAKKPPINALAPVRHPQQDFFVADIKDFSFKDDVATMEAAIFSLATKPDCNISVWESENRKKRVRVSPDAEWGRATQHDKDVLIFITSQLVAGMNLSIEPSRTVRFRAYDFLVATNRPIGGSGYIGLLQALQRLKTTNIETNIDTGKQAGAKASKKGGFSLISEYKWLDRESQEGDRTVYVEVELCTWIFEAISAKEVVTIHKDYFRLRSPTQRRLYEIARKHVGSQERFRISLDALMKKVGTKVQKDRTRAFRATLKAIAKAETLPGYSMHLLENDLIEFRPSAKQPDETGSQQISMVSALAD